MTTHARERDYDDRDDELSAVARSLHREWNSPGLWPSIEAGMRAHDDSVEARLQTIVTQSVNPPSSIVNC